MTFSYKFFKSFPAPCDKLVVDIRRHYAALHKEALYDWNKDIIGHTTSDRRVRMRCNSKGELVPVVSTRITVEPELLENLKIHHMFFELYNQYRQGIMTALVAYRRWADLDGSSEAPKSAYGDRIRFQITMIQILIDAVKNPKVTSKHLSEIRNVSFDIRETHVELRNILAELAGFERIVGLIDVGYPLYYIVDGLLLSQMHAYTKAILPYVPEKF